MTHNRDTRTRAQKTKAIRVENEREALRTKGLIQHVLVLCDEIGDVAVDMPPDHVNRKKVVIDTKLKLINKILPDLKSAELQVSGSLDTGIDATTVSKEDWAMVDAVRAAMGDKPDEATTH